MWVPGTFDLPYVGGDYVILTPADMLTKDEVWINRTDMIRDYPEIAAAVPNDQLRAQINNYFQTALADILRRDEERKNAQKRRRSVGGRRSRARQPEPTRKQLDEAARSTYAEYPGLMDIFVRFKEDTGDQAEELASERVRASEKLYISQVRSLSKSLAESTCFYDFDGSDASVTGSRLQQLKVAVEQNDGWKAFYTDDGPISREADLRVILRLIWVGTPDPQIKGNLVPGNYRVSSLVLFKLATSRGLGDALASLKVEATLKAAVVCFSRREVLEVRALLRQLKIAEGERGFIINAKPLR